MHIAAILRRHRPSCSFEFFPPKGANGVRGLFKTLEELESLSPAFVSVTYGAGGSTRQRTHDVVVSIQEKTQLSAVSHLTCVGHSREDIDEILTRYARAGIGNVMALGGDPPASNPNYDRSQDAFRYAAELVAHIKAFRAPSGTVGKEGFGIGVACFPEGHPATPNRLLEMDLLKAKVEAGADYLCTQMFFDNRDFFEFRERCELYGIRQPILAGIMPVASKQGLRRMASLAAGVRFPAPLLRQVNEAKSDADVERIGTEWATAQCEGLLAQGACGIHFYTLNRSRVTRSIYQSLEARSARAPFSQGLQAGER